MAGNSNPTTLENDNSRHDFSSREGRRNKYLIFTLSEDRYAVPLNQVKEVIGMVEITSVPHVPSFFKGLINLRGKIISVIDMREKLAISKQTGNNTKNCIIISEMGDLVLGAIVDDVYAVFGYEEEHIERQINIQSKVSSEYIMGVAKATGQPLTLLLDLAKLLDVQDLKLLREQQQLKKSA